MTYSITPERQALLDTIAYAEGTHGRYDLLFGFTPFDVNGPHPNVAVPFGSTFSTAAGRYQFIYSTWHDTISKVPVPDVMLPANQDQAALQLIASKGALADVDAGRIEDAITKISYVWASLPPGRYGQPVKTMGDITSTYQAKLDAAKKKSARGRLNRFLATINANNRLGLDDNCSCGGPAASVCMVPHQNIP